MSSSLVQVELVSAHLPRIEWEMGGASSPPSSSSGIGELVGRWLRPAVRVRTPFGDLRRAPWGDPPASSWPLGAALLGGLFLVTLALAWVGLRHVIRGR